MYATILVSLLAGCSDGGEARLDGMALLEGLPEASEALAGCAVTSSYVYGGSNVPTTTWSYGEDGQLAERREQDDVGDALARLHDYTWGGEPARVVVIDVAIRPTRDSPKSRFDSEPAGSRGRCYREPLLRPGPLPCSPSCSPWPPAPPAASSTAARTA